MCSRLFFVLLFTFISVSYCYQRNQPFTDNNDGFVNGGYFSCPSRTFTSIIEYEFCEQTSFVSNRESTIRIATSPTTSIETPGWIAAANEYPFVVFRRDPSPHRCMGFLIRLNLAIFWYRCGENLPFDLNFGSLNAHSDYTQTRQIVSNTQISTIYTEAITISFNSVTLERAVKPIVISNSDWFPRHNVKNGIEVSYSTVVNEKCPTEYSTQLTGSYINQVACPISFNLDVNACPGKSWICVFRSDRLNLPCNAIGPSGIIYFDEVTQQHVLAGIYTNKVQVECSNPQVRTYPKMYISISFVANTTLYSRFWNTNVM
jgi:hypothetical protein